MRGTFATSFRLLCKIKLNRFSFSLKNLEHNWYSYYLCISFTDSGKHNFKNPKYMNKVNLTTTDVCDILSALGDYYSKLVNGASKSHLDSLYETMNNLTDFLGKTNKDTFTLS